MVQHSTTLWLNLKNSLKMRKGFIFNGALCVNCKACIAACLLENRPDNEIRTVYIYNKGIQPGLPVINLSLACNHCKNAACLKGCPARALTCSKIDFFGQKKAKTKALAKYGRKTIKFMSLMSFLKFDVKFVEY